MNSNLMQQLVKQRDILEAMSFIAHDLPEEGETCRYALSGESILLYMPYDLSLLYTYRDHLLERGFIVHNQEWELNGSGVVEHEGTGMDSLRFYHPQLKFKLVVWLKLKRPKSDQPKIKSYVYSGPMPDIMI